MALKLDLLMTHLHSVLSSVIIKQESRAAARKPRDAASVLFC